MPSENDNGSNCPWTGIPAAALDCLARKMDKEKKNMVHFTSPLSLIDIFVFGATTSQSL